MKEFGIYTAKDKYIDDFQDIANKSFDDKHLKIINRPSVCIKLGGQNWLVPLSSIDPRKENYEKRYETQHKYNEHDKENPPFAMDIWDDLAKTGVVGYESVVQYFNAIPIKHKYSKKYRQKKIGHVVVDKSIGNTIKRRLIRYLKVTAQNRLTGFIKHYTEKKGKNKYYPINCFTLQRALYKDALSQHFQKRYRINRAEERRQTKQHQKDLKNLYLERGEYAAYEDLSNNSQPDLSGYVGKESAAVISKETQQDLHTTQNKNQSQQVRQVGQVEQVGLVGQVGQARKSQNNVKQKAKAPNSAGKR